MASDTSSLWDGQTVNFDDLVGGGGYDWHNRFITVGGNSYRLLHGYMVAGLREIDARVSSVGSAATVTAADRVAVAADRIAVAADRTAADAAAGTATSKAGEAGAARDAAASYAAQARGIIWVPASGVGGTANAITLAPAPPVAAYAAGLAIEFVVKIANTAAVTVNISGLGGIALVGPDGAALSSGALAVGSLVRIVHDGTSVRLSGVVSAAASETIAGVMEVATKAEIDGGTDNGRAVSPKGLRDHLTGGAALFDGYREITVARSNTGTALTLTSANVQRYTLTGAATLTLPAVTLAATDALTITVDLLQDGTGGRTVTWATPGGQTISWNGSSTAPSLNGTAGKRTRITFTRLGGESGWTATVTHKDA